jgi:hypothetical protein
VFDAEGQVLARWGNVDACAPGSFAAPHGLAVDSRGDICVSEVTWTFAVSRSHSAAGCHTFQRFALAPSSGAPAAAVHHRGLFWREVREGRHGPGL